MSFDVEAHHRVQDDLLRARSPHAVVTLVDVRGSAPQIVGAKAIITEVGLAAGTIGGGKIEAAAIEHAKQLIGSDDRLACSLVTWNLQTDIGMTCGGEVKLVFEVYHADAWSIAVFGAGHVAQSLIPMLCRLRCQVTCIDARRDWLDKLPAASNLDTRCVEQPLTLVCEQPANAFFVLISKGHATDLPVLAEILKSRKPPYVGVIGSPQKASVLRREIHMLGIPAEAFDQVHCPIGLSLGNNTPAEISISILAQLIQVRDTLGILKHKTKTFAATPT